MSLFAFVVVSLLSVVFWRQVVAALLATVVLLLVLGIAFVLQGIGVVDRNAEARPPATVPPAVVADAWGEGSAPGS